jgi:hypothetical protein
MSAIWGWALALVAIVLGWFQWGWQGVILAISVVVFWLLLQFSRAMRVMRQAAGAPIGHVDSAVMLNAKLRAGMRLMEIIPLTRSLGQAVEGEPGVPETFTWTDTSGACVRVQLVGGRLRQWSLERPAESPADSPADSPAAAPLTAASDPAPDQASVQASVQAPERGAGA